MSVLKQFNGTTWVPVGTADTMPAAPSALSATKLASVNSVGTQGAAHGGFTDVDFTGGTIVKGAAYWGVPDSALDLDVTIVDGSVQYPQSDRQYDVAASVVVSCNAADAGKLVGLLVIGNAQTGRAWAPVAADGSVGLSVQLTDQAFVGGPSSIGLTIDATYLTIDVSAFTAALFLTERGL